MTIVDWYNKGSGHIWYPYTQMQNMPEPTAISSASGCSVTLADGRKLIDGISSWWSSCHGYNHPHINEAIVKQLEKISHFMFAGVAHEPAYNLAWRLCKLTGLDKVFFTDSGSTAVETSLKIAVQYWKNKGHKRRNKFICFKNSYHGDTMGCMSICDPDDGMHKIFNDYMPKQYSVNFPNDEYGFSEFDALIDGLKNAIAGVVIEPLVQGAGGMKFHSSDMLAEIYRITKKHGLLFIADEVMTGFGRTGNMFACQEAAITPDILCLGKALTGGTMTLAATLTKKYIFEEFLGDSDEQALMNGPTFMANPLACAAANASLDLFETEPRLEQVDNIEKILYDELSSLASQNKIILDVRVKGAIAVIQIADMHLEKGLAQKLHQLFIDEGIWLRPFGDIVYIMPPFIISKEELLQITDAVKKVVLGILE